MSLHEITILSDAGHGGPDPGAINAVTGLQEKHVVLDVSLKYGEAVERISGGKIKVIQSRGNDRFLPLAARRRKADEHNAKLISWHCNAGRGTGFEAFTYPGESGSDKWATSLLDAYEKAETGINTLRGDYRDGDPDKEARFAVLKTRGDAVLFELGFIDRPEDEKVLASSEYRTHAAEVLAMATCVHFGYLKT